MEREKDFILRGITKNVFILGMVSLFTDISSEMIYPLIPIFLTAVLGAPMAIVGVIEGIAESTASILKVFSGWFSDKLGKRRSFIVSGYSCSAVAKPLLAAAFSWPVVLVARFIDRFGKGVRTSARDAMIADETNTQNRGKAFGFHRAMDTSGAVLGPLLALVLLTLLEENYRLIFLIALIPAVTAVVLLLLFVKERVKIALSPAEVPKFNLGQFDRRFKLFLLIILIFGLGNSSDVFLIMRAKNLGFSTMLVVVAYVLYNSVYALLSTPAGILSDRIGRRRVIMTGFFIFAAVYFGFAFVRTSIYVWGLFAIYGFYVAMTEGVSRAFVSDLVPTEKRGTALGIFHTTTGLVTFAASFIAGLLWTYVSVPAPFIYGGIMAALAAILFFRLLP